MTQCQQLHEHSNQNICRYRYSGHHTAFYVTLPKRNSLALTSEVLHTGRGHTQWSNQSKDESGHKLRFDQLQSGQPMGTLGQQLQVPGESPDPGLGPGPEVADVHQETCVFISALANKQKPWKRTHSYLFLNLLLNTHIPEIFIPLFQLVIWE